MRRVVVLVASLLAVVLTACGTTSTATPAGKASGTDAASGLPWVAAAALPSQARTVIREIHDGGPFAHPGKDGSRFGNYEGLLPKESSGYYQEYTVDTPGASTRSTRRIIAGKGGELYYTDDHYESFRRIRE